MTDESQPHLRPRSIRALREQARMGHALADGAEALARDVDAALLDAARRVEVAEKVATEAVAFRGRFVFECDQHFRTRQTIKPDDLVRLLERAGEPPAGTEAAE